MNPESDVQTFVAMSDEALAARCANRPVDDAAWMAFYVRFHGYVRYLVWSRLGGSAVEVDDAVQQAFLKIFLALPRYRTRKAKLKTFLTKTVRNTVIDVWRHGAKLREVSHSLEEDLSVLRLQAKQDPEILHEAAEHLVRCLTDKSKVPFYLDVLQGEKAEELMGRHHVSDDAIRKAKRWLRARLGELLDKLPNY